MDNHYHHLLETPAGKLVAGMNVSRNVYGPFNARHRLRGHLFAGRYKAVLVEREKPAYGRVVSDYIHLNPARARIFNAETNGAVFRYSAGKESSRSGCELPTYSPGIILTGDVPRTARECGAQVILTQPASVEELAHPSFGDSSE